MGSLLTYPFCVGLFEGVFRVKAVQQCFCESVRATRLTDELDQLSDPESAAD